jgi:hypothetical protein
VLNISALLITSQFLLSTIDVDISWIAIEVLLIISPFWHSFSINFELSLLPFSSLDEYFIV